MSAQRARRGSSTGWRGPRRTGVSLFSTADAQGPWRRVSICGLTPALLQPLIGFTLSDIASSNPGLLQQLTGSVSGTISPGSPVQNLLDSGFGTCNYNNLPTAP